MTKINVLVFEPHATGHHGPYLEWMVKGLLSNKFRLTIITSTESMNHPSVEEIERLAISDKKGNLNLISYKNPLTFIGNSNGVGALFKREFFYWKMFRKWFHENADNIKPNVVFLPYLDYCLYAIGLLGSPFNKCPWVGLAMRPSFHYQKIGVLAPQPALSTVKRLLFHRVLGNRFLRCLLSIDEPLIEYLKDKNLPLEKYAFLPEPAALSDSPDSMTAKRQLGLPEQRKLILVYGAITVRKGVFELLKALQRPDFPENVDVLFAGKLSDDVNDALMLPANAELFARERLRLLNRFISKDEEPVLFSASDIIWLGYRQHYNSSGVLVQAASAGRPVIACREGVIGWQTKRHNLGAVVSPSDSDALIEAIYALLDVSESSAPTHRRPPDIPVVGGTFSDAIKVLGKALTGE